MNMIKMIMNMMMILLVATSPINVDNEGTVTPSDISEMNENMVTVIQTIVTPTRGKTMAYSEAKNKKKLLNINFNRFFGISYDDFMLKQRRKSILSSFRLPLALGVAMVFPFALVGAMATPSQKMTAQEFKDMMLQRNVDDTVEYFQDLMEGEYPSWKKPWKTESGIEVTRPLNVLGYRFKGQNIFNFSGYELPIFGTKKQWYKMARSMGIELIWNEDEGQYFFDVDGVSTPFWNDVDMFSIGWQPMMESKWFPVKDSEGEIVLNPKTNKPKMVKKLVPKKGEGGMTQGRPFMTWNIEATNLNWDDVVSKVPNFEHTQPEPITPRDGEQDIIAKLSANMAGLKVKIGKGGRDINSAYYRPSNDTINMPPSANFDDMKSFIGTLAHEMSHATGHRLRLARNLSNGFGSKAYAQEEIVAEFSAFIICRSLGVEIDLPQHGTYLKGWSRKAFDGDISLDTISESDLVTMRTLLSRATQSAEWVMSGLPEWFMGAKTTEGQDIPDDGIVLNKSEWLSTRIEDGVFQHEFDFKQTWKGENTGFEQRVKLGNSNHGHIDCSWSYDLNTKKDFDREFLYEYEIEDENVEPVIVRFLSDGHHVDEEEYPTLLDAENAIIKMKKWDIENMPNDGEEYLGNVEVIFNYWEGGHERLPERISVNVTAILYKFNAETGCWVDEDIEHDLRWDWSGGCFRHEDELCYLGSIDKAFTDDDVCSLYHHVDGICESIREAISIIYYEKREVVPSKEELILSDLANIWKENNSVKGLGKDIRDLMSDYGIIKHEDNEYKLTEKYSMSAPEENERVYDKYQVYLIHEDGTRSLYGEYESISDAEIDLSIESSPEDFEIIEKSEYVNHVHRFGMMTPLPLVALSLDVFTFGGFISTLGLVALCMASMIPSRYDSSVTERPVHEAVSKTHPDGFDWSSEQIEILNDFAWWHTDYKSGNMPTRPKIVISSSAGSGKTTVVQEQQRIVKRIDSSTKSFASAFNRHIAKILKSGNDEMIKDGFFGLKNIGQSNTVSAAGYSIIKGHLVGQGIDQSRIGVEGRGNSKYLTLSKQIFSEYLGQLSKPKGSKNLTMGKVNQIMRDLVSFNSRTKPNFRNTWFDATRQLCKLTQAFMNVGFVPTRSRSRDMKELSDIYSQIAVQQGLDDIVLLMLPSTEEGNSMMFELARNVMIRSLEMGFSQKSYYPFSNVDGYSFGDCIIPRNTQFPTNQYLDQAKYDSSNLYPLWKTITATDEKTRRSQRFQHIDYLGMVWPPKEKDDDSKTFSTAKKGQASCKVTIVKDQLKIDFADHYSACKKIGNQRCIDWLKSKGARSTYPKFSYWLAPNKPEILEMLEKTFTGYRNGISIDGDDGKSDDTLGEMIVISFSDMTWLPHALKLHDKVDDSEKYDMAWVDEIQDLSEVKGNLIRGLIKPESGLVLVGDSKQSIMGFSGSDSNSMSKNAELSSCISYPMSTTWRNSNEVVKHCNNVMKDVVGKAVGTFPNATFPDFDSHVAPSIPDWKQGIPHTSIGTDEIADTVLKIRENDPEESIVILSRVNAPLGKVILQLVAKGIPVSTPSDDGGILSSIKKIMTRKNVIPTNPNQVIGLDFDNNYVTISSVRRALDILQERAFGQSMIRNKGDSSAAGNDDKYVEFCQNCELTGSLLSLFYDRKWKAMESKTTTKVFMDWAKNELFGSDDSNPVNLSSVHKFKGGEADTAILLRSVKHEDKIRQIFMHPSGEKSAENMSEELCILYVALTRSKIRNISAYAELDGMEEDDIVVDETIKCCECNKAINTEIQNASCPDCEGFLCNEYVPERGLNGGKLTRSGELNQYKSCGEFLPKSFDELMDDEKRKEKEFLRPCKSCYGTEKTK